MDRRILVVDDSELICQQLSQLLSHPDRQITIATDGTAAMEWLVEHPCSLVLTDLRLPGISGLDLIQQIRDRELPGDGHRDDRVRHGRVGGRGDEAGCLRPDPEAARHDPSRAAGESGARRSPADR